MWTPTAILEQPSLNDLLDDNISENEIKDNIVISFKVGKEHKMWQKEHLINVVLVNHLPAHCEKVILLDLEVLFVDDNWVHDVSMALNRYDVMQPYSHCLRLNRQDTLALYDLDRQLVDARLRHLVHERRAQHHVGKKDENYIEKGIAKIIADNDFVAEKRLVNRQEKSWLHWVFMGV